MSEENEKRTTIHRTKGTKEKRPTKTDRRSATRKRKTKREGLDSFFFLREITTEKKPK
jgi:hypothetical protein